METAVVSSQGNGAQPAPKPKRASIIKPLLAKFGDGKWYAHREMAQALGITEKQLRKSLTSKSARCERKKVGSSGYHERIFAAGPTDKVISLTELKTKLAPLIEGLATEGRKDLATFAPNTVRRYASQMAALLDDWSK